MRHEALEIGTLFIIPLSGGRVALGQIVQPGIEFYICVYLPVLLSIEGPIPSIESFSPALCCLTTDAALYHGRWTVRGKADLHPDIPYPHFKINDHKIGGMVIKDLQGNLVRRASTRDIEMIPYRTNVGEKVVTAAMESLVLNGSVPAGDEHMLAAFVGETQ